MVRGLRARRDTWGREYENFPQVGGDSVSHPCRAADGGATRQRHGAVATSTRSYQLRPRARERLSVGLDLVFPQAQ